MPDSDEVAVKAMRDCITELRNWMITGRLLLRLTLVVLVVLLLENLK